MAYVELHAHSAFTFLEGASLPEQLAERAGDLGYEALAITDRDDVGGLVRFVEASDKCGLRPIFGAELTVRTTPLFDQGRVGARREGTGWAVGEDLFGLVLLAKDAEGWANLSTLISIGRFGRPRGRPYVTTDEVAAHAKGLVALSAFLEGPLAPALRAGDVDEGVRLARPWLDMFGDDWVFEVQDHALPEERLAAKTTLGIARRLGRTADDGVGHGVVATNHVHHVTRAAKPVEDVLRCIKHQCTIDDAGDRLFPNAERHLRTPAEMRQRFRRHPELVRASLAIAERCAFHLKRDLVAPLPCFPDLSVAGCRETADEALERLTWEGARVRYPYAFGPESSVQGLEHDQTLDPRPSTPDSSPVEGRDVAARFPLADRVHAQLRHELELVRKLKFAGYFLILYDVVRAAKERKILVQGRGSAANSAICYCLGITAIDPIGREMLFERFLSEGRAEPPDIDLDIEHERREELLQYVYQRYGRGHAAMVAAVHTFQPRAAAKDVARVLGLSVDQGNALAALCDRFVGIEPTQVVSRQSSVVQVVSRQSSVVSTSGPPLQPSGDRKQVSVRHGATDLRRPADDGRPRPDDACFYEHPRGTVAKAIRKDASAARNGEAVRSEGVRSKEPTHEDAAGDGWIVRMDPDRLRDADALRAAGLDPNDRRVAMVPWFVDRMLGLPRHRAIHTGGFVLSERPIGEVCPIEWASMHGRSILQWEKDDISTLGLVKFDLLGLGMLTVLAKHLDLLEQHRGVRLDLWQLPHDDPEVFDMICKADTIGLFQIESRAQMTTLPRLQPRQFYDLVVEVALIRPGPIQGEMVHPYLRRRRGEEPITYLHPSLEPHLARTLGVPLFQEQGMKIAIEIGGFSPSEADALRRAMAHKRSRKAMDEIGATLVERMRARGFDDGIAERIVKQLTAFADYGFPESHAASFALLVWASAYLKLHYGPEFYAAILNAQPMGFYSASTLIEDAKRHHVVVRGPCVMASEWDCTLEGISPLSWVQSPESRVQSQESVLQTLDSRLSTLDQSAAKPRDVQPFALRVGLRYVRGLGERTKASIARALSPRPRSIADFVRRAGLDEAQLLSLAHAGAFDAIEPERRRAIWEVMRLAKTPAGPLDLPGVERDPPRLPAQSEAELVAADFQRVGLTPRDHPMAFLRGQLDARGVVSAAALAKCRRRQVKVAGLVICRQRPGTAKGFVFLTLEDEGGMVNIVVEPSLFERLRNTIVANAALEIDGELERDQDVINIKAKAVRPLALPWAAGARSHDFH
ncbi:MAG: PHP domain-containing protein [Deltaproteobacteria bacterium]|nr:PHP domain-containing protein [Deltaproteobacteria bacterium]